VLARYGLDEAADEVEAAAWGRKFAADPAVFASYKALFQRYRSGAPPPAAPGTGSSPPPPMHPPSNAPPALFAAPAAESNVVPTAALNRVLTLGEHATMSAELLVLPEDTVYAKYDLADPTVRGHVLRICELRLEDPTSRETWKRLNDIAVKELQSRKRT
jgi:hypothetical protein